MAYCKLVLTRLLFFLHGSVSIYLLYHNNSSYIDWRLYFIPILPLLCLVLEGFITIHCRNGREMKYFWPSGFFYIATIIPIIWITEFGLLSKLDNEIDNMKSLQRNRTSDQGGDVWKMVGKYLRFSNETIAKNVCELGLVLGILIGRWLTPRSSLTRNELSALLINYVGSMLDIMELSDSLDTPGVSNKKSVSMAIVAIYTWAFFQFALITTARHKKHKDAHVTSKRNSNETEVRVSKSSYNRDLLARVENGSLRTDSLTPLRTDSLIPLRHNSIRPNSLERTGNDGISEEVAHAPCCGYKIFIYKVTSKGPRPRRKCLGGCKWHSDYYQILVTLLMHDGPFLILRLSLSITYKVSNELHVFFLIKNLIVCILYVYRLIVICADIKLPMDSMPDNIFDIDVNNVLSFTEATQSLNDGKDKVMVIEAENIQNGKYADEEEKPKVENTKVPLCTESSSNEKEQSKEEAIPIEANDIERGDKMEEGKPEVEESKVIDIDEAPSSIKSSPNEEVKSEEEAKLIEEKNIPNGDNMNEGKPVVRNETKEELDDPLEEIKVKDAINFFSGIKS